jgi:hypothetical protein
MLGIREAEGLSEENWTPLNRKKKTEGLSKKNPNPLYGKKRKRTPIA